MSIAFGAARADAPLLPAGSGQMILELDSTTSSAEFDGVGKRRPASVWRQTLLSAYLEWGVTEDFTAIVASMPEWVDGADGARAGFGPTLVGMRAALARIGDETVSIEGGVAAPATSAPLADAIGAGRSLGWSADLIWFRDVEIGALSGFLSLRVGWSDVGWSGDGEWRTQAAFGLRPTRDWLVLLQAFGSQARTERFADGHGSPEALQIRASLVRDLSPAWSVQAGAFVTPIGSETRAQSGVTFALWRRFR